MAQRASYNEKLALFLEIFDLCFSHNGQSGCITAFMMDVIYAQVCIAEIWFVRNGYCYFRFLLIKGNFLSATMTYRFLQSR